MSEGGTGWVRLTASGTKGRRGPSSGSRSSARHETEMERQQNKADEDEGSHQSSETIVSVCLVALLG